MCVKLFCAHEHSAICYPRICLICLRLVLIHSHFIHSQTYTTELASYTCKLYILHFLVKRLYPCTLHYKLNICVKFCPILTVKPGCEVISSDMCLCYINAQPVNTSRCWWYQVAFAELHVLVYACLDLHFIIRHEWNCQYAEPRD